MQVAMADQLPCRMRKRLGNQR